MWTQSQSLADIARSIFSWRPNQSENSIQRGNRLRESLPTFITLHKARAVYHCIGRLEQIQNFTHIQLLEILYVLVDTSQI